MKDTQVRDGNKQVIDLNLGDLAYTEIIEAHSSYTLHQQLTILAWYLENMDRTVFHNTQASVIIKNFDDFEISNGNIKALLSTKSVVLLEVQ